MPPLKQQPGSEAEDTKEKLNQALYDLRKTQEQNKLNGAMAQELEDKVNSLEAELKVALQKREQLQEENVKLRSSLNAQQEDGWSDTQTESSSAVLTRYED
nr:uncharacterized protein LOC123750555 [Procambarus clarkii]